MEKAVAMLEPRRNGYTRPLAIRTGINRRRQCNLYDPDGTRAELMEPHTVDGKPAPDSTAASATRMRSPADSDRIQPEVNS